MYNRLRAAWNCLLGRSTMYKAELYGNIKLPINTERQLALECTIYCISST